ncbi:MAG: hypothetical protein C0407_01390 [Desulfobacca sp.]|nr:hypothetical protein [Desulfobacca sp.]
MTLSQWAENGWLRHHKTSPKEIENLLHIVYRDLSDAQGEISTDSRFGIAYNAALKLCAILLNAEGYKPEKNLGHYRSIQALPLILGEFRKKDTVYLDACRSRRNTLEFDYIGGVTEEDLEELIDFVEEFKSEVLNWPKEFHSNLLMVHEVVR